MLKGENTMEDIVINEENEANEEVIDSIEGEVTPSPVVEEVEEEKLGLKQVFKEIGRGFKRGHQVFKNTIKNRFNKITGFFKNKKAKKLEKKQYEAKIENAFVKYKNKTEIVNLENKIQFFEKVYILQNGINLSDCNVQLKMDDIRRSFSNSVNTKLHDQLGFNNLYTEEDYETFEKANGEKVITLVLKGGCRK